LWRVLHEIDLPPAVEASNLVPDSFVAKTKTSGFLKAASGQWQNPQAHFILHTSFTHEERAGEDSNLKPSDP
jgi:hypothetical protein